MTFNRTPPDMLNHVILGAGVIFSGSFPSIYELQDKADNSSILGATSGGVSVNLTPQITTFSGDGNSRRDANYIRYDAWTAKLSCKLVTLSPALFEYAFSGAEKSALSQLEVIPQWCGVNYCYGGWQLVDITKGEEESTEEKVGSGKVKSVAETEALLSETGEDTLEGKTLVETGHEPIYWEDIPWQILRDLRLSIIRDDEAVVYSSEDWKNTVPSNSTFDIEIDSPSEDSVIEKAYTVASIGEGRYQFKPHTHTRLSLQTKTGSILMNIGTKHICTAKILPAWNYTLDDEEAGAEQAKEEEDNLKVPKEQYVWQILTYTGDPIDIEGLEGLKPPDGEEGEEREEGGKSGEDNEGSDDEEEVEEQEQIAFSCGQTVTVKALNPGTVVLRCTATRLDARESSDLIISVLPVGPFYVKKEDSETAEAANADDNVARVTFMVKVEADTKEGEGAETLAFAEKTEDEGEGEDGSDNRTILEFVKNDEDSDENDGYVYFMVGYTDGAQSDIEKGTKEQAGKYAGRMALARQQIVDMELQDSGESKDSGNETEEEYDETLEVLKEAENTSGWSNASAVGGGVSTATQDVWWVGNYGFKNDGSQYIAIHLKNAVLTSGLEISSGDAKLTEVNATFEAAYDDALDDAIPFEVYISDKDESSEPGEEGTEE